MRARADIWLLFLVELLVIVVAAGHVAITP